MSKIKGKIIRIIDTKTVIINLGKEQGVVTTSDILIHGKPEDIIDPDAKKSLGRVVLVKARLRPSQIFDKFTIASTQWAEAAMSLNSLVTSTRLYESTQVDEVELRVLPEEIKPWKAKSEEPVRVGDVVEVEIKDEPGRKGMKEEEDIPF